MKKLLFLFVLLPVLSAQAKDKAGVLYDATITQLTLRTRNSVPTLREAMALNPDEQLFSVELAPKIK